MSEDQPAMDENNNKQYNCNRCRRALGFETEAKSGKWAHSYREWQESMVLGPASIYAEMTTKGKSNIAKNLITTSSTTNTRNSSIVVRIIALENEK